MEIQVMDNNVEKAIRVLKRKLQQEGLFREMKRRKFYEKPSVNGSVKKKRLSGVCGRRCGRCRVINVALLHPLPLYQYIWQR